MPHLVLDVLHALAGLQEALVVLIHNALNLGVGGVGSEQRPASSTSQISHKYLYN